MQSLLRWSIENSTPYDSAASDRPPVRRDDLNPEIIDMILGKPDSVLMKEDVAVAIDASKSEDDRVAALDHLEMLIEQIDNANNLEVLNLWEPLQALLTSDAPKEVKVNALWVIGTALQNNPMAQECYLRYNPLPTLLSFLTPSTDSTVQERSKAIYTVSGLLKHNAPAVKELSQTDVNGWEKLKAALQDPQITVRRKTVFLLNTLLLPTSPVAQSALLLIGNVPTTTNVPVAGAISTPGTAVNVHTPDTRPAPTGSDSEAQPAETIHPNSHAAHLRDANRSQTSTTTIDAFKDFQILDTVISSIVSPLPYGEDGENTDADVEYEEKALRVLFTYIVTCRADISPKQKEIFRRWFSQQSSKASSHSELEERWNLTTSEYKELSDALAA